MRDIQCTTDDKSERMTRWARHGEMFKRTEEGNEMKYGRESE